MLVARRRRRRNNNNNNNNNGKTEKKLTYANYDSINDYLNISNNIIGTALVASDDKNDNNSSAILSKSPSSSSVSVRTVKFVDFFKIEFEFNVVRL